MASHFFFPIMFLHPGVNEFSDVPLIAQLHLASVIFREIGAEVLNHLSREVIQQISVVVARGAWPG
jgi:hypothetical protein